VRALIVVDVQNDFVRGGALAVPEGDIIVPLCNRLMKAFDLVVATQDWHPANHASFAINHPGKRIGDVIELNGLKQILWPAHCVQGMAGAMFVAGLETDRFDRVFQKGTDPEIDSYSGFFDNGHRKATGLETYLKLKGVNDVFVCGLATDYCVKFTAMDAREQGFTVSVVQDACRGVNLKLGDVEVAINEMKSAGVAIVNSEKVIGTMR
jgi:nicotinamidase/pyrazinamidase